VLQPQPPGHRLGRAPELGRPPEPDQRPGQFGRRALAITLTLTAVAYFALFTSSSLATALPAAAAVGAFGSMSEVIPQTAMQRVIPNDALGRVSAVFLTGEAAATLIGAVTGPFLAQAVHLPGIAAVASATTLLSALLAFLTVPPPEDAPEAGETR
jgi:predicted MFS family arabinose efflux permease